MVDVNDKPRITLFKKVKFSGVGGNQPPNQYNPLQFAKLRATKNPAKSSKTTKKLSKATNKLKMANLFKGKRKSHS